MLYYYPRSCEVIEAFGLWSQLCEMDHQFYNKIYKNHPLK